MGLFNRCHKYRMNCFNFMTLRTKNFPLEVTTTPRVYQNRAFSYFNRPLATYTAVETLTSFKKNITRL
jgi:hypothetical protein